MCLAVPMEIKEINDDMGKVESGGVSMDVGLSLITDVKIGDWVIVHAGFAISKLNKEDAMETLSLFDQMADAADKEDMNKVKD